jgi:sulfur carrier protein
MTIHLNGTRHELDTPLSVSALLDQLGLGEKPVLVELNEQAIFPRDYPHTQIEAGARVELVTLAAGG